VSILGDTFALSVGPAKVLYITRSDADSGGYCLCAIPGGLAETYSEPNR
jgi:hypothetical protein